MSIKSWFPCRPRCWVEPLAFPEAGSTQVPARLPFLQVTARALAYMFIFSVTTMSLLSLKRNPGNFWLMAGNRPELVPGSKCSCFTYACTSPELRHQRSSSRVPVNPLPRGKFHGCCFPSSPLGWGVGAAGAQPHAWIPSCFSPCSSPCPWNHTCETGHLLGGAGCLKCRIPSSIPGNHTLRGSSCCHGMRLSSSRGEVPRRGQIPRNWVGWNQRGPALGQCLGITSGAAYPTQELLPVRILLETLGILHSSSHNLRSSDLKP